MLFTSQLTIVALLAFIFILSVAAGSQSADRVASEIDVLTTKTQAIQKLVDSINKLSGTLFLIGLGPFPKIIRGFTDLANSAGTCVTSIHGSGPFTTDDEVEKVFGATIHFFNSQTTIFQNLEQKAPIIVDVIPNTGGPMVAVLVAEGAAIDQVEDEVFAIIPTKTDDITVAERKVDVQLGRTVRVYGETFTG